MSSINPLQRPHTLQCAKPQYDTTPECSLAENILSYDEV